MMQQIVGALRELPPEHQRALLKASSPSTAPPADPGQQQPPFGQMDVDTQSGTKRPVEPAPGEEQAAKFQVVEDTSQGRWAETPLGAPAVLPAGSMQPMQQQLVFPADWHE